MIERVQKAAIWWVIFLILGFGAGIKVSMYYYKMNISKSIQLGGFVYEGKTYDVKIRQ